MYVGPTGLLVQSVTNTPRIEYDPVTLVKRGLLMEATRTNLTLQSQNFATSWTTGSSSISTNLIAAPDGTTTADKLVSSSGSAAMFVGQAFTLSATTVYNFSVFAKYISGEARYVAFRPDVDSAPIVSFDLVNNVVVTTTAPWSNAVMTQYANGWYRLSANYTTVGTAYTFRISIDNTGTAGSFTGNGSKGVYLWGSQLELGLFPTSYIPTTTASVARTQDACSRALGTEFSATAGTFVVQGRAGGGQAVGARQVFCAVTDGTVSNTIPILRPGSSDGCQLRIEAGGVNQTAIGATFTNLTSFKIAGAWVVNSVQMAFNGVLLTEDTVATIPTVTTMHIGNEIGGNVCNGHIARFDYTPGRKSNGRLAALSA